MDNIETIGKNITRPQLNEIQEQFKLEQEKWDSIKEGMHFIVEFGYGGWSTDAFHHEIFKVDSEARILYCYDHSQDGINVEITRLPDELFTSEEFYKKYKR